MLSRVGRVGQESCSLYFKKEWWIDLALLSQVVAAEAARLDGT